MCVCVYEGAGGLEGGGEGGRERERESERVIHSLRSMSFSAA